MNEADDEREPGIDLPRTACLSSPSSYATRPTSPGQQDDPPTASMAKDSLSGSGQTHAAVGGPIRTGSRWR